MPVLVLSRSPARRRRPTRAGRPVVVTRTCDAAAARMHDWSAGAGESARLAASRQPAMPLSCQPLGAVARDEADA